MKKKIEIINEANPEEKRKTRRRVDHASFFKEQLEKKSARHQPDLEEDFIINGHFGKKNGRS